MLQELQGYINDQEGVENQMKHKKKNWKKIVSFLPYRWGKNIHTMVKSKVKYGYYYLARKVRMKQFFSNFFFAFHLILHTFLIIYVPLKLM